MNPIINLLSDPTVLLVWAIITIISILYYLYDIKVNNPQIMPLMKWIWGLTMLFSGPIGLAVYFYSGRKQISQDSIWRRGFRSDSHCYSGCAAGEIVGMIIAVGILGLSNAGTAILTFAMAYIAGFSLTVGPLLAGGETFWTAFKDALYSETPSIAIMEIAAIGTDFLLAGSAGMMSVLFWSGMIISMSVGYIVAWPVNVLLIKWGVKEGMMNPKEIS